MPKPSWSPAVKQRVKCFLEELLSYVLDYRDDLLIQYRWENECSDRPKLIVETKRRFLVELAKLEKQEQFYEIINRLKDLDLYEEQRGVSLRGKDNWQFGLKLWSQDQQKNLIQFDKLWELTRPEKSKKLDNKIINHPENTDNNNENLNIVLNNQNSSYRNHFFIGLNVDLHKKYYLDLDCFVQNNIGIFGNLNSGKSYLTRLLLSGFIQQQLAVNLIFDLHSEYGWENRDRYQTNQIIKGLQQIYPDNIDIYTVDTNSKQRRGIKYANDLYISYDQIEVEDIGLVSSYLEISPDMLDNAYILSFNFGKSWISKLLSMRNDEIQTFVIIKMEIKSQF